MKIDVDKLIDQVSRHPEIYNPDHKDFADKEITENIFNNVVSKAVDGINGEILRRKWDQILKKYASFIRKLSNDDSSETVLERFMEWPWTKKMRIFKPYVRKQFQIPEFEPAALIPEMDPDDLSDIPVPVIELARPRPGFARPMPAPRQEFPHPLSMPRPEFLNPASAGLPTSFPYPAAFGFERAVPSPGPTRRPAFAHGVLFPSPYADNVLIADGRHVTVNDPTAFRNIATMMGLDQPSDDDGTTTDEDTDDGTDDGTGPDGGSQPAAKRTRRVSGTTAAAAARDGTDVPRDERGSERSNGSAAAAAAADDGRKNVLPDLPRPESSADRRTTDFTVQEHTFLAWAKTMSTFTAKRQAKIKMKINKIMSEAEFEDLDDEFFAANSPPRRSIYTSRR